MFSALELPSGKDTAQAQDPQKRVIQPRKGRVDEILHGARARKIAIDSSSASVPSPTLNLHADMVASSEPRNDERESSADEETSIIQRGGKQNLSYQSTTQHPPHQPKAIGSHPSTTSIRRAGRVYQVPEAQQNEECAADDGQESWWARLLSEYGSIELENKGSVARDHLALGM
jgi:hypothetical protein